MAIRVSARRWAMLAGLLVCSCGGGVVTNEYLPGYQPGVAAGEPPAIPAPQSPGTPASSTDCGASYDCLIQYAAACGPAYATVTDSISVLSVTVTSKTYLEIKAAPLQRCALYQRSVAVDSTFPPGTSAETESTVRAAVKKTEGKDGTCVYDSRALLVKELQDRRDGNYEVSASGSFGEASTSAPSTPGVTCSGPLFDELGGGASTAPSSTGTASTTGTDTSRSFGVRLYLSYSGHVWARSDASPCTAAAATDCQGALHVVVTDDQPPATAAGKWAPGLRVLARHVVQGVDLRNGQEVATRVDLGAEWPLPPEQYLRVYAFLSEAGDDSDTALPQVNDLVINGPAGWAASAQNLAAWANLQGDLSVALGMGLKGQLERWVPSPGTDHCWSHH